MLAANSEKAISTFFEYDQTKEEMSIWPFRIGWSLNEESFKEIDEAISGVCGDCEPSFRWSCLLRQLGRRP